MLLIMAIVYMIVARIDVENGEPASNVIFPLISAAGCRLLFHIRSKERAQVLGLNNTAFTRVNGAAVLSEDLAATGPIEFKVFSREERAARERRGALGEEEVEVEGVEYDYESGDYEEAVGSALEEQERTGNEVLDPPRSQTGSMV